MCNRLPSCVALDCISQGDRIQPEHGRLGITVHWITNPRGSAFVSVTVIVVATAP